MKALLKNVRESVVSRAIVISGSARSGTTIMGKLISTFQEVEYFFEPRLLIGLMKAIGNIDEAIWRELYETYLFDEFLLDMLAGRRMNLNRNDDSSVWHVKPNDIIESRLNRSIRLSELVHASRDSVVAYKHPDYLPNLSVLRQYYPRMQLILMHRNAGDSIRSLVEKGWFSNDSIYFHEKEGSEGAVVDGGVYVPYWVEQAKLGFWMNASHIDRAAYYYMRCAEMVLANADGAILIDYDAMVQDSRRHAEILASNLGVKFGPKTTAILKSITPTNKDHKHLLGKAKPWITERINRATQAIEAKLCVVGCVAKGHTSL